MQPLISRSLLLLASLSVLTAGVPWTTYDGVSIPTPPAEHPRLYLRVGDIPDLERRTRHAVLRLVWDSLQAAGKSDPAAAVEADAVRYLLAKDDDMAKAIAVSAAEGVLWFEGRPGTYTLRRQ